MDLPETLVLKDISSEGLSLHVIYNPEGENQKHLENENIALTPLVCKNKLDLRAILKIRKLIAQNDYDIVHAFTSRLLSVVLIATLFCKNKPKILAYRGAIGNIKRNDPTSWLSFLNPRVKGINCVSRAVEDYLYSVGVSREKLRTIYKGHKLEWYGAKEKSALLEFGIPVDAFVVACTANIRKTKGIDLLIEAAKEVNKEKEIHFLIIGQIKDKEIEELAKDGKYAKFIHFTGFRSDASALAGACDVFALPSRDREGLPKALIEAMALGMPCIVTNVGGMPELIRNNQDGIVINKESVSELTQAIHTLHENSNRREQYGKSAKNRIKNEFHISNTAKNTIDFYRHYANA